VVRQDATKAASEAHTLKGMLSNLSCKQGTVAAGYLEKLARERRASDLAAAFAGLEHQIKKLMREIETLLSGVSL